jgi:hypothetical protein
MKFIDLTLTDDEAITLSNVIMLKKNYYEYIAISSTEPLVKEYAIQEARNLKNILEQIKKEEI